MWLNDCSFYVFWHFGVQPKQFSFVLMHDIFINRGYKARYTTLVQRVCNYVQLEKAIVKTRFQYRNAGHAGYVTYLFICFFVASQGYKSFNQK